MKVCVLYWLEACNSPVRLGVTFVDRKSTHICSIIVEVNFNFLNLLSLFWLKPLHLNFYDSFVHCLQFFCLKRATLIQHWKKCRSNNFVSLIVLVTYLRHSNYDVVYPRACNYETTSAMGYDCNIAFVIASTAPHITVFSVHVWCMIYYLARFWWHVASFACGWFVKIDFQTALGTLHPHCGKRLRFWLEDSVFQVFLVSIFSYSVRMRENTDLKSFKYRNFSRSAIVLLLPFWTFLL